jgi:hypothetical protein
VAVFSLDFGTSSIRAALREENNQRIVLPLGLVSGASSLDEASIRSDIAVDPTKKTIYLGDAAVRARAQKPDVVFYESSPKLWIKEDLDGLEKSPVKECPFKRRDLLIAVLANAFQAVGQSIPYVQRGQQNSASNLGLLKGGEICIARPLWPEAIRSRADEILLEIGVLALELAPKMGKSQIEWKTLAAFLSSSVKAKGRCKATIEPIATAADLLENSVDTRRICAVVDIGAGTTDVALFQASDSAIDNLPNKLFPLGKPRSLFLAGNAIDSALNDIILQKLKGADLRVKKDIVARGRFVKEALFRDKRVSEFGVSVLLDEFESSEKVRYIADSIRAEVQSAFDECQKSISDWLDGPFKLAGTSEKKLVIVMAGGGASLPFLRKTLEKPYTIGGRIFQAKVTDPPTKDSRELKNYGATRQRLAVALGSVSSEYERLIFEHANTVSFAGLGHGKQLISTQYSVLPSDTVQMSGEFERGRDPWLKQITLLKDEANQGCAAKQFEVARLLSKAGDSEGLTRDAFNWYLRAARQGHVASQINLGVFYVTGRGTKRNNREAWFWWRVAEPSGDKTATEYLKKLEKGLTQQERNEIDAKVDCWRPAPEKAPR